MPAVDLMYFFLFYFMLNQLELYYLKFMILIKHMKHFNIFIGLHQHGMTMKQEVHSSHYIEDITKYTY